jgi:hypothetical protein
MSQFINKAACRRYLLDRAASKWPGKMTRVANEVFEFLDSSVRTDMEVFIRGHPTIGKTLTTGVKKEPNEEN